MRYSVQVSYDNVGKGPWMTVAKCVDESTADALAFALHNEGRRTIRVRVGTKVISTFPHGGTARRGA